MSLTPGKNTADKDQHQTPPCIAQVLTDLLDVTGRVLEPGRGDGAFYNAFPDHSEKLWCEINEGRDFFGFHEPVDWIVTNPPFSLFFEFLRHSVELANDIAYYCTINHAIALRARNRFMRENKFGVVKVVTTNTPPEPWPQSGFQVGLVHWRRYYDGPQANSHIEHQFPPALKRPKTIWTMDVGQDLQAMHAAAQTNGVLEALQTGFQVDASLGTSVRSDRRFMELYRSPFPTTESTAAFLEGREEQECLQHMLAGDLDSLTRRP